MAVFWFLNWWGCCKPVAMSLALQRTFAAGYVLLQTKVLLYLNAWGPSIQWHGHSRSVFERFFFFPTFLIPGTIPLGSNALPCWEGLTGGWQQVLSLATAWNWQVIKIWSKCSERGKWRFHWASGGLQCVK